MPDVLSIFSRWWKIVLGITVLATGVAAAVSLLLPPKYVSIVTALPASSFTSDKSAIFNNNIQQLYPAFGTPDDLDRVIGSAQLDTIYRAAALELNLANHYGLVGKKASLVKAARKLKQRTTVRKSEWGELKVKVWDSNRVMAARMANRLLETLQRLHQNLQNQSNQLVLQRLQEALLLHATDTVAANAPSTAGMPFGPIDNRHYREVLSEYRLTMATNPPVLLVVEAAQPALSSDRSEMFAYMLITFFAALLFSFFGALHIEGRKAA